MTGPLSGLKVVEIGVAMAGPFCGMILADHGAEVIKVERVGHGDDSRDWPPHFHGAMSHYFASINRTKRSLAVDLKSARGVEVVRDLAAGADVLVENYRVGALDRAGLGYEALSHVNHRLIYCSISGFGREGPRAEDRANDLFMQAYSGGMSITGEVDGGPVRMGISVADVGAGMFAATGVLSALEARHRTGRGQHVTTSLLAGQLAMLSYQLTAYFATGNVPEPQGSGAGIGVPYQAFPTADDWLVVAVFNDTMWRALCGALDRPDWAEDARLATIDGRIEHRDEVLGMLTAVFATKGARHWAPVLEAAGIPSTPVNRLDQVVSEPQVQQQGLIAEVDVEHLGPVRMAGPAVEFGTTPGAAVAAPPRVGQHTREILRQLDLDDTEIDRLAADGAVGLDVHDPARA